MLLFCNYLEAHIMMWDIMLLRVFLNCYKRILLSHQIIVSSRTHATSHPHSSSTLHYHSPSLLLPPSIYFSKKAEKAVGTPPQNRRNRRNKSRCGRKEENTGDEKGFSTFLWCDNYFCGPLPLFLHHLLLIHTSALLIHQSKPL